jgi:hypothetical protein
VPDEGAPNEANPNSFPRLNKKPMRLVLEHLSASLLQTELWKTIHGSYCTNLIGQRGPYLTLKASRFVSFSNFGIGDHHPQEVINNPLNYALKSFTLGSSRNLPPSPPPVVSERQAADPSSCSFRLPQALVLLVFLQLRL